MHSFFGRLAIVGAICVLSIGLGVLITQEGGRAPLYPEQVSQAVGIDDFAWSPDGKSIAYVSALSGNPEIWIVSATGGDPRRITSSLALKKQLQWSRDGKWIAYVAVVADAGDIQLVSADGKTTIPLTQTPGDDLYPEWSPDSSRVAFAETTPGHSQLSVVDLETKTVRNIAEMPAANLKWSADGTFVAFVSNPLVTNDDRRDNQDVFVVSTDGGPPRLLTPGTQRFRDAAPSWSPDSRHLVYTSESNGYSNLFVVDSQTGSQRSLTADKADNLAPEWSPDGNNIAYVRNEALKFHIWAIPAQGGRPIQLSERDGVNGGFKDEDASPRGAFHWSPDGKRIAYTHSDPAHTSDLWVVNSDGSGSLQLTNSMPVELRREARFVWPEVTTYRSFDGEEISGLVYKPRGAKPKAGFPALFMFRDSLEGQNAFGWNPFVQFFVSNGFVLFAPNVRGSSGRGKEYRQLVYQNGGDYDVRDAFIGLDRLSSEELVDTQRVGVFGAGTGGFLATAALIKDEARFKAAVCLYGIVDATTAASYGPMGGWTRYMIGDSPINTPIPFYERSLVNFVDKLKTPIIFLYTANDSAAPFQQLQQFAVQASVKGKWFDYRVFENEADGWQHWRPADLRLALEAMDALFQKYLLGRDKEIRLSRNR